jgi:hypothetical protein
LGGGNGDERGGCRGERERQRDLLSGPASGGVHQ